MNTELDISKTVKKSNVLNELRNSNASLVEYRLFCVYLAHLPMNSENNVVKFSLADYARIVGLDRPRKNDLYAQAENIVQLVATIDNQDGGFSTYSLFSEFKLFKDKETEQWTVSLECNSKIAPMIREQKNRFLRYKLYNTIYLKSYNQQRIYELLKQYERIGSRDISLVDLRAFLSIEDNEYPLWYTFSRDVLKVAQKALKESTDIYFDYEPWKKGRKVVGVKFTIHKNHSFIDQLRLDDFLPDEAIEADYDGDEISVHAEDDSVPGQYNLFNIPKYEYDNEHIDFLASACNYEFSQKEMDVILSSTAMKNSIVYSPDIHEAEMQKYNFLSQCYAELNLQAEKRPIDNRFAYFKGILANIAKTED